MQQSSFGNLKNNNNILPSVSVVLFLRLNLKLDALRLFHKGDFVVYHVSILL